MEILTPVLKVSLIVKMLREKLSKIKVIVKLGFIVYLIQPVSCVFVPYKKGQCLLEEITPLGFTLNNCLELEVSPVDQL